MNYKYEDLVVIPKSVLDEWIEYINKFPLYPEDAKELKRIKQAEPLLPIVEDFLTEGKNLQSRNQWITGDYEYGTEIYTDYEVLKQEQEEFVKKGIEL